MRTKKISHIPKKSSKSSSSSLRRNLTIAFLLLAIPVYHQEVVTLFRIKKECDTSVLCKHTVKHELEVLGVKHSDIVTAQSLLETGEYRSQLVRTHNNLFGFRTKKGYLKFDSWQESCAYYKRWQTKRYKGEQDYYAFLTKIGYAEDPEYTSKLKIIIKNVD